MKLNFICSVLLIVPVKCRISRDLLREDVTASDVEVDMVQGR